MTFLLELPSLVTPDAGLLIWQILIFGTVMFLLAKFAWKPIMNALKERESFIDDSLKAAERAKQEMAQLQATNEKLLAEARSERDKMLREAQTTANNIINEAKDKASVEASRLVESAKAAINAEKAAALAEVKSTAATLSIEIAEKILKRQLADAGAQQELVAEYLKDTKLN